MAEAPARDPILAEVAEMLDRDGAGDENILAVLERVLERFDCAVGSIHKLSRESGKLELIIAKGIPETIREAIRTVPIGKGMAGLAAQRLEPVQICNLQTDDSGMARPGARDTKMEGTIALPLLVEGQPRGTLGVAKPVAYEFTPEERQLLMQVGAILGEHL